MGFHYVPPPPGGVFRLGRESGVFVWRKPSPLGGEEPDFGGNRFDDPEGQFRTIYAATTPYGCWIEKLRTLSLPPASLDAAFSELDDDADPAHDLLLPTTIPGDFFVDPEADPPDRLVLGFAQIAPGTRFVDLMHPATHHALQTSALAREFLNKFNLKQFDAGVVYSQDRRVTRALARQVWTLTQGTAIGLRYTSAQSGEEECWALWDDAEDNLSDSGMGPVDERAREFRDAATVLGICPPEPSDEGLPEGLPESC